ncbi:MAG TPA: tetratricopeptide repeat protein [Methanobacterium sp.]|nr:tetratricopeptide repeat protein [Methanobacterium sp.]
MTLKNTLINAFLGFSLGIVLFLSLIYGQILQILFFLALPSVIAYIFTKLNKSKTQYLTFSIIILIFATIIQFNSLESIIPPIGGLIVTLIYTKSWEMRILVSKTTALIKEYKMEEALPYLDKMLELNPQSFYALYNKAAALNLKGEYGEALKLCNKILENKPDNVLALNMKAHLLLKLERYDESLEILDKVLKKDPKNEFALSNKALVLSRQWKYEESLKYFEDALKRISGDGKMKFMGYKAILPPKQLTEIWFEKGKVHQRLGQHEEALECFDKALELDPDSEQILKYKEVLNFMK